MTLGETYDKGGLRRVGDVDPLWSYVKSVRIGADGTTGDVVIVACTRLWAIALYAQRQAARRSTSRSIS